MFVTEHLGQTGHGLPDRGESFVEVRDTQDGGEIHLADQRVRVPGSKPLGVAGQHLPDVRRGLLEPVHGQQVGRVAQATGQYRAA
jgi:hypothetical protein